MVYVTQFDDGIFEDLTVREQVEFTARLSGVKNPTEKSKKILEFLGISEISESRIGGKNQRGISGGEKKRAAIANELISDPSIAFLDEPTSGLDSKSALDIAMILRMMSHNGRTIVSIMH